MLNFRAQIQCKAMLNAQHYAQVPASNLMLKFKVQTLGLSSGLKVEAKIQSIMMKLFAECNPQNSTQHKAQRNTKLHS